MAASPGPISGEFSHSVVILFRARDPVAVWVAISRLAAFQKDARLTHLNRKKVLRRKQERIQFDRRIPARDINYNEPEGRHRYR